ncbi:ABC transporter permease [Rhabdothermincola sp.]|uniref:ABC transporter permease n=1 Tax=Rhabdothermincola sp. TaxID=2820405 RepID=UPI002FE2E983
MTRPTFAGFRSSLARRRPSGADVAVFLAIAVVLYTIGRVAPDTTVSLLPNQYTDIDTDPARLPYYAVRSLLRMFAALAFSYAFTFVYGYAAARSRRAERVLIPALDILQSVPVLGFLSITVVGFVALFPGSLLGLECAAIFAIFTSQVWNITFGFYQSLITLPREFDELSRLHRLSRWMRFWRIEVPSSAIGLVWNGMMSMGGGWFFLVASEAITVNNNETVLPGVGSYAGAAIDAGDLAGVGWAIVTMVILVLGVNVLFWRPLTAWVEKFRNEQAEASEVQRSFVLELWRRSRFPRLTRRVRRWATEPVNRAGRILGVDHRPLVVDTRRRRIGDLAFFATVGSLLAWGAYELLAYITREEGPGIFLRPIQLGVWTMIRVAVVVVASTLLWVPVGVRIGLDPRLARIAQPLVQIFASFPANFLFPLVVVVLLHTGISLDIGGIVLMALGAQWYILFNAIAGGMAIPTDLREAMTDIGVTGWQRWKRLYLPAIFPSYVTGGITASGGAWNASIVAEVVTYGGSTITAVGLGAFISESTAAGDFPHTLAGVMVMSAYVVLVNRLLWRRLYRVAEARYHL